MSWPHDGEPRYVVRDYGGGSVSVADRGNCYRRVRHVTVRGGFALSRVRALEEAERIADDLNRRTA